MSSGIHYNLEMFCRTMKTQNGDKSRERSQEAKWRSLVTCNGETEAFNISFHYSLCEVIHGRTID